MSKIIVVGSLNMDLVITTPRIPAMGETIMGSGFMTVPGGKGANQAVVASRLGGDVHMVGCVGEDIFGRELINNLNINGVNTENVRLCEGVSTGIAVITVKDGDNSIILSPGANFKLTVDDVLRAENLIRNSSVVIIQLEIPLPVVAKTVELCKKYGVKVILNPAPARQLPDDILKNVDIITPNESETEILTGIKVSDEISLYNAVSFFKSKGIQQVVITMGKNGVAYNKGDEIIKKGVPEVKAVDTTAAGDSFSGALAVQMSQLKDIDESIDFCNLAGTLAVMKKGAQTSLPWLQEVLDFK